MKVYPKYPTAISALAFSPDGSKLVIGASYEHDNAVSEGERGRVMVLVKDTVMEDCKVSFDPHWYRLEQALNRVAKSKSLNCDVMFMQSGNKIRPITRQSK